MTRRVTQAETTLTDQRPIRLLNSQCIPSIFTEISNRIRCDGLRRHRRQHPLGIQNAPRSRHEHIQHPLLELNIGLERARHVRLAVPGRVQTLQLLRQVRERGDAHCGCEAVDGGKFVENGRIDDGLGVLHARGAEVCAVKVEEGEVECRGGGGRGQVSEVYESGDESGGRGEGVRACAAPHVSVREGEETEGSHEAEVVAAAAEGEVEVWVGGVIYIGDGAIGEDDL